MRLLSLSPTNYVVLLIITTCLLLLLLQTQSTRPPFACDSANPSTKSFPFCKTDLPLSRRVQDLVSRLTLDEKISQLVNSAPPISRLGIPAYEWWAEALHGVANAGPGIQFVGTIPSATSFPQVILTAASFDARLWYCIGQVSHRDWVHNNLTRFAFWTFFISFLVIQSSMRVRVWTENAYDIETHVYNINIRRKTLHIYKCTH